ncbi:MAG: hypothetical protein R3C12_25080 [Planctomycetaceae bacterium]
MVRGIREALVGTRFSRPSPALARASQSTSPPTPPKSSGRRGVGYVPSIGSQNGS